MTALRVVATLAVAGLCACGDDGGDAASADAAVADAAAEPDALLADAGPDAAAAVEVTLTTYHRSAFIPVPATWVAAQDGDGPWQTLDSDDGHYRFAVSAGRYSVAVMCQGEVDRRLYITRATTGELPSLWHECDSRQDTGAIQVTALGAAGRPEARVTVRNISQFASGSLLFPSLAPARYDVIASDDADGDGLPDELAFEREVPVVADSTASATVDLARATATSPFSVTVAGVDNLRALFGYTLYATARGTRVLLSDPADLGSYRGLPTVADGDRHVVHARDVEGSRQMGTWLFLQNARDVALELPPPFTLGSVSAVATEPSVRVQATFDAYPEASFYELRAGHLRLLATPGWLGAGDRHTLEQPDLSEVDGWQDSWALADDTETYFEGAAITGPVFPGHLDGFGYTRAGGVPDATTATRASYGGSFTP